MRTLVRPVTVLVHEQARSALSGSQLYPVQLQRVRSVWFPQLVLLPVPQLVVVATAYIEPGSRKTADVDSPYPMDHLQYYSFDLVLCSVGNWFCSAKASGTEFEVGSN